MSAATHSLWDAALEYARHGWPVFPLKPRAKDPHGKFAPNGFYNATRDERQLRSWWEQCPEANIGIPTGRAIDAWVLDFDCKNGDVGLETYDSLLCEREVRETRQQVTGSGGKQLFFAMPGFDVPSFGHESLAGVGLPGCDIKGTGGYIVAPPSIHPDTGGTYSWDGLEEYHEQRILGAPSVLLEKLGKLIERRAAPKASKTTFDPGAGTGTRTPETIPEGQRNETLFKIACSLRCKGLSEAAIRAALIEENRERCSPPMADDEVRKIAQSAGRYARGAGTWEPSGAITAEVCIEKPTIDDLNRLAVWAGRVAFAAVRRRGQAIEAVTPTGRLVRWRNMSELGSFAKAQQAIAAGAGVFIPTPPRTKVRAWWDAAASLLVALGEQDCTAAGDPIVLEAETLVRESWAACGYPQEIDGMRMGDLIEALKRYERRCYDDLSLTPVVFLAEGMAWVHPGKWRTWLGTPRGMNRHYAMSDLHDLLAALDFRKAEDTTRRTTGGETVKVDLWAGGSRWLTGITGITGA